MLRDPWQVETREHDNPARPVVLRTTLLPIGDVMLAVDCSWWRRASQHDRQKLLAEHCVAITAHLTRRDRVAKFGGLAGALAGAGLAWVAGLPLPAVVPGTALVGWAAACLSTARQLRAGLCGTHRT